jgi:hypothetical protein
MMHGGIIQTPNLVLLSLAKHLLYLAFDLIQKSPKNSVVDSFGHNQATHEANRGYS